MMLLIRGAHPQYLTAGSSPLFILFFFYFFFWTSFSLKVDA
jgi:hypothetical protein